MKKHRVKIETLPDNLRMSLLSYFANTHALDDIEILIDRTEIFPALMADDSLVRLPDEILMKIFRIDHDVHYLSRYVSKTILKLSNPSFLLVEGIMPIKIKELPRDTDTTIWIFNNRPVNGLIPLGYDPNHGDNNVRNIYLQGGTMMYGYFTIDLLKPYQSCKGGNSTIKHLHDCRTYSLSLRSGELNESNMTNWWEGFDIFTSYRARSNRTLCMDADPNYAKNQLISDYHRLSVLDDQSIILLLTWGSARSADSSFPDIIIDSTTPKTEIIRLHQLALKTIRKEILRITGITLLNESS